MPQGDPSQHRYHRPSVGGTAEDMAWATPVVLLAGWGTHHLPSLLLPSLAFLTVRKSFCALSQKLSLSPGLYRTCLISLPKTSCLHLKAQNSASIWVFLIQANMPASLVSPGCHCLALSPSQDRLPTCPLLPSG